jgi:hypothetical protein
MLAKLVKKLVIFVEPGCSLPSLFTKTCHCPACSARRFGPPYLYPFSLICVFAKSSQVLFRLGVLTVCLHCQSILGYHIPAPILFDHHRSWILIASSRVWRRKWSHHSKELISAWFNKYLVQNPLKFERDLFAVVTVMYLDNKDCVVLCAPVTSLTCKNVSKYT